MNDVFFRAGGHRTGGYPFERCECGAVCRDFLAYDPDGGAFFVCEAAPEAARAEMLALKRQYFSGMVTVASLFEQRP
jgi:hypothetical protein